jgi:prevent-host-death family protein
MRREKGMKQQISLREASQHLSRYIEAVERGDEFVITKRGRPVAKLVKITDEPEITPEQAKALQRLFAGGLTLRGKTYRREEIYEERMAELETRRNRKR